MDTGQFVDLLAEKGIVLGSEQLKQFETYYEWLVDWNNKMNLTAITEKGEVYLKHFFDSVTVAFFTDWNGPFQVCDVGAGAGFPSIPLKICFPELSVTIVDSLQKRITFLEHLTEALGLKNVFLFHDRAETFAKKPEHREKYDIVTARAVARMSVLSELCLPLVKNGGRFIAMKALHAREELEKAEKAIQILGGKTENIYSFILPVEESERNIIVVKKIKATPKKYPRKPGTPAKIPLE
ncbi:ribosomal RNA small subunit methyltransferase G [Weizmannia acidilactici]|uniref:Ribosomal RNA small subunit methyltransferase G n=1 Tax=Weizmannia acidilactici TaxID=2607726 RepID=A0A5J4JDB9_9BACI|nr:16S rRNA (guanine(527)-N(7))-methyltransferase RsmG [Weizmannia acidilactici]GER67306.1 ribosomal RNA small subunit methyltransferase G [Weizmannia acidilactici]GER70023.1 ribosomal RNA small subunit methyltransferase G [Weizmannia acidilactici]GER74629.1 ribosomal RNA small subunit methyltransferase G [Weizmannia acidilactici]